MNKIKNCAHDLLCNLYRIDGERLDQNEWEEIEKTNTSNDQELIAILKKYVTPEYLALNESEKTHRKESFKYLLNLDGYNFSSIFDEIEMPFGEIEDGDRFFKLLWIAIYHNERYDV